MDFTSVQSPRYVREHHPLKSPQAINNCHKMRFSMQVYFCCGTETGVPQYVREHTQPLGMLAAETTFHLQHAMMLSCQNYKSSARCSKLFQHSTISLNQAWVMLSPRRIKSVVFLRLMHQSIPAAPIPPPGQLRGICTHCQSRGSGISLPKGYSRAFDTHMVSDSKSKRRRFYRKRPVVCY